MKKMIGAICALLLSCPLMAQDVTGKWLGSLDVAGSKIRIVFNINLEDGKLVATMDSPDQGVKDINCGYTGVKGDSLFISIPMMQGTFKGKIADVKTVKGILIQGPMTMPLELTKQLAISGPSRPQTPKPPYSYKSEDVTYANLDKSISYGATITIPNGEGQFPALLLISGSGQQNRDEELFDHKPFAVLADYLTKKGYIVLRVDDMGIGKTTGDPRKATTEDFVKDAQASLQYLRSRKEVDKKKIGIYGHSEGGLIAEIIAAKDKELDFVILAAAPGGPIPELMAEQNDAIMKLQGVPDELRIAYIKLYKAIVASAVSQEKTPVQERVSNAVKKWQAETPKEVAKEFIDPSDEKAVDKLIVSFMQTMAVPWTQQFLSYDAGIYLEKIRAKVLAINGEKDVQVVASTNLTAIDYRLKNAQSHQVVALPGLNHLFQQCKTCMPEEYKELEETISPVALKTVGDWLDKEVKNK